MADDYLANTRTTGTVAVGGSARGDINYGADRDWFAVTLEAGRTYRIDLEGWWTGDGTLRDPYLYGIHDANGALLAGTTDHNGGTGFNSRVYFTAPDAGTYYVVAGAWRYREGTYTLSVTEVVDDFAAGTWTSGVVVAGESVTGEIDYRRDRDWFAVDLDAGRTYRIDLEGSATGAGTLRNPYLRGIHDADGVRLAGTTDNNGGQRHNSRVYFTAAAAGTYYVAAGASGSREGTYKLSVAEDADDFADGTGTSGALAVGGSATGEIDYGYDRDWFAVDLEAGRTYRIDLKGSSTGGGTLTDPYLRGVYDADGVRLAGTTNDDGAEGNLDSGVTFTAEENATYYVAAGASGSREGTYTLSVTAVTNTLTDDFSAGTGTSGALAVGGSATGEIDYGRDRDWFAVDLDAGRTYRIDLEGSETRDGTLYDPYLRGVYDANGVRLAGTTHNDNGGFGNNSRVTFTAADAGTYYVAAGARRDGEGTYTLTVTAATAGGPGDLVAGTGTSSTVAVGGTATSKLSPAGDEDWFAVTLEAGRVYWIDLEGRWTGAGTLWNPYLRGIHDADGNRLAGTTNDNAGVGLNSRVRFMAEEDGTYYVAAGAVQAGASIYRQGTYTLSVTEVPDDFSAGTGTSGALAVGRSARGKIETEGDRDWFAVDLDAGGTYLIDLKGSATGSGNLRNSYLYGIHDANGDLIAGTTDNDGGFGSNSRVTFTAGEAATYYVVAGAHGNWEGTYTLSVEEVM